MKDGQNKQCVKCKVLIPITRKDNHCRECRREYNRQWEAKNKDKRKKHRQTPERKWRSKKKQRLKKYGLTLKQWDSMRELQDYKCLICGIHEDSAQQDTLCVDHCHNTGKVRGLLCHNCNRGVGLLKDSISNLENALKYLKDTK